MNSLKNKAERNPIVITLVNLENVDIKSNPYLVSKLISARVYLFSSLWSAEITIKSCF